MKYLSLIGIALGILITLPTTIIKTEVGYITANQPKLAQIAPKSFTTISTASYMSSTCQGYKPLLSKYSWNVNIMVAICAAESHGNTYAVDYDSNGTVDRGVLQINSTHDWMVSNPNDLFNPAINIATAYKVWLGQSYSGWSTYLDKAYLAYL